MMRPDFMRRKDTRYFNPEPPNYAVRDTQRNVVAMTQALVNRLSSEGIFARNSGIAEGMVDTLSSRLSNPERAREFGGLHRALSLLGLEKLVGLRRQNLNSPPDPRSPDYEKQALFFIFDEQRRAAETSIATLQTLIPRFQAYKDALLPYGILPNGDGYVQGLTITPDGKVCFAPLLLHIVAPFHFEGDISPPEVTATIEPLRQDMQPSDDFDNHIYIPLNLRSLDSVGRFEWVVPVLPEKYSDLAVTFYGRPVFAGETVAQLYAAAPDILNVLQPVVDYIAVSGWTDLPRF